MTAIIDSRPRIPRLAMVFIAAVVVLLLTAPKAGAWDAKTDDGFTISRKYSYSSWSDVTVTGYSGQSTDITFPEKVTYGSDEYTVTCIGTDALKNFKNSKVAINVTIPNTYTSIDTEAFQYCEGLTSITIPGSITNIGFHAFDGSGLTSVTFSEGTNPLKFGAKPFMNCTSLTALTIPARTSSITNNPIDGCTSLQTLSVESGSSNFYAQDNTLYAANEDAYSLISYAPGSTVTSITIPATVNEKPVTKIDMGAFQNNTVIQDVTIPASVTAFGSSAFDNCSALKKVSIAAESVTLSGSCFTNLAPNSVIEVANDTVKNSFESTSTYTKYYTAGNTTVQVKSNEPEPEATPAAALTLKGAGVKEGYSYYKLSLDSAANVSTMIVNLSFDAAQVSKTEGGKNAYVSPKDTRFSLIAQTWKEEEGKVKVSISLMPKDNQAITSEDASNLLLLALPVKANVTGNLAATVDSAECAGVVSNISTKGRVTVNGSPASNRIVSYDVNADNVIDILDITEAQRFYRVSSSDTDNWSVAQKADVNGDGEVDIQDLIDIFLQIEF